jgi:chorismate-pyruvate lyase
MNNVVTQQNLIESLLTLKESTTYFLEAFKGDKLKVKVLNHTTVNDKLLKREAVLFFSSAEKPALYSISYMYCDKLSQREHFEIMEGQLPIGKIFGINDGKQTIDKRNITASLNAVPALASKLHLTDLLMHKKSYDYST